MASKRNRRSIRHMAEELDEDRPGRRGGSLPTVDLHGCTLARCDTHGQEGEALQVDEDKPKRSGGGGGKRRCGLHCG